ncbi:hypothetical protein [Streptomyces sp. NPDC021096]|uniref:hypothetical protein n=1 Tax=Streptomyces sp. NPDC021096 TaxID=3154792 RepID=UPI0033ED57CA
MLSDPEQGWVVLLGDPGVGRAHLRRRLNDAAASSRPVRELAGNPILLTILSITGRRQELPRHPAGRVRARRGPAGVRLGRRIQAAEGSGTASCTAQAEKADRCELLRLLALCMQEA